MQTPVASAADYMALQSQRVINIAYDSDSEY